MLIATPLVGASVECAIWNNAIGNMPNTRVSLIESIDAQNVIINHVHVYSDAHLRSLCCTVLRRNGLGELMLPDVAWANNSSYCSKPACRKAQEDIGKVKKWEDMET